MNACRSILAGLLIFVSAEVRAAKPFEGKIVMTGSSTVAPLALELGKRFEKMHPGVRVDVQTGGSSRGLSDARQGLADIGLVSRELKESEKDLQAHAIAFDGVAVIVHKSNPIRTLSREQLLQIFTGQVKNWSEIGGQPASIVVVNKAAGRSTLELFADYLKVKPGEIKAQIVIGDNEQGIKTVSGNPLAIGYVSIGAAEYNAEQGVPLKLLPLEGIVASVENVKKGSYPLARPLNLVSKPGMADLAKEFIAFSRLGANADLVKEQYFVPLAVK